ncbi:valine--tRNA ligase [Hyphobacterium marinum]|uniref:Valine--tRNA ligase n=1 Tax=Hyphobacterium marinum TaxID=3116574 RepID=A0ABU7M1C2_9PROT|nr:valine--tRNA ligase [Hyphobacterium sp. Y6023]MEE2567611.1 valine--tRNA ligase [Hyphobacterium sp. Y6023]
MLDKTFTPKDAEPRLYAAWEDSGHFKPKDDPDAETYSIVIPPPNVTGSLHIGHALNNTLQDVLIRYHRMQGKAVLWQPGTDHAGIATQMVVERQLAAEGNISRRDMGRDAFVERVWEWKEKSGGTILNQLRRLGASCDWSRERFTMDEGLSKAVIKVFVELHQQGLIYRDKRLVNWDPHFQTAISDLEVENREIDGHYWRFRYPLADGSTYRFPIAHDEDGNPTEWEERDYIVVATTRPETMLGDTAVAVHPDDARYAGFVGKSVRLPIADVEIPIIADEHADPETGSGAVKITPAHDFNDFMVGERHNLPRVNLFDRQASLLTEDDGMGGLDRIPPELRGMDRFEARKTIVAMMDDLGLLDGIDDKKVMQPFGDRSGVVVEPYMTDQWFVKADVLARDALAAVEDGRTTFHPKSWEKTYFEWMRNIQPWCISRQLWWGHRIPAWYGPSIVLLENRGDHHLIELDYNEPIPFVAQTFEEARKVAFRHYEKTDGIPNVIKSSGEHIYDGSFDLVADRQAAMSDDTLEIALWQDEDVLDTWFSSALWPFSTLGWPEETEELKRFYPTSVLVTAFDIIFFWVARMMMQGLHFMEEVPFPDIYIHALVRDEHGAKMSKSKGNVIDPLELIDEYGADAVRFTLAALAAQGRDIRMSKDRVEGYRNFGTKLWNAARFCQMNDCRPHPDFDPKTVKATVNRWILSEAEAAAKAVSAGLDTYRFNEAAGAAYRFVWNVFCDWHLEFAKPLLSGKDEAAKAETRATTAYVLDIAMKLLHPFMPFVTEELWSQTAGEGGRDTQLIVADWPRLDGLVDAGAQAEMNWLVDLTTDIRRLRSESNIPAGAKLNAVIVGASAETKARLDRNGDLLKRLARLDAVTLGDTIPDGSLQTVIGEATIALPLEGVIDTGAEKDRLAKEIAKVEGEIARLDKKLGNERFVANAPAEVVEGERAKRADYAAQKDKLSEALARLG